MSSPPRNLKADGTWTALTVILGGLALAILLIQLFGGTPGTHVQPRTPAAEPVVSAPQP